MIKNEIPEFDGEITWCLSNGVRVVLVKGYNQISVVTIIGLKKHVAMKLKNKEKLSLLMK